MIMDTKWKRLFDDPGKNYGISQADMYQMYAYSKKYQDKETGECPEVWLLYPDNPDMKGRKDIQFKSGDGTTVQVRLIDLKDIEADLLKLNEELGEGHGKVSSID